MNHEQRAAIIRDLHNAEDAMVKTKGREYSMGAGEENPDRDVLRNFKQVGDMVQVTCPECKTLFPIGALATAAVYKLKHVFSMLTAMADPSRAAEMSEPFDGRVIDDRTYDALILALWNEQLHEIAQGGQ